jgi:hypothetical protein
MPAAWQFMRARSSRSIRDLNFRDHVGPNCRKDTPFPWTRRCWHEPCCTGKAMIAEPDDSDRLTWVPKLGTSGGPLESLLYIIVLPVMNESRRDERLGKNVLPVGTDRPARRRPRSRQSRSLPPLAWPTRLAIRVRVRRTRTNTSSCVCRVRLVHARP